MSTNFDPERAMLEIEETHDEEALRMFRKAMEAKLKQKREEGRGGWWNEDDCELSELIRLLEEHADKCFGHMEPIDIDHHQLVDIANLAMMIWFRVSAKKTDKALGRRQ